MQSSIRLVVDAQVTTPQQRAFDRFVQAALDVVNVENGRAADVAYTDTVFPLLAALEAAAVACRHAGVFRVDGDSEPF